MKVAQRIATLGLILCVLGLTGCGGDEEDSSASSPIVTVSYGIKQVRFAWAPVAGATHYKLFERVDANAVFTQVGPDITTTSVSHEIALHRRLNATYRIDACSTSGCTSSDPIGLAAGLVPAVGYVKASNPIGPWWIDDFGDLFGSEVALSADGNTLAIGAYLEDGDGSGGANAFHSGAVYVFTHNAGVWAQQAYLKASNIGGGRPDLLEGDFFGRAVALSADGNTLAVGAPGEDSNAVGIDGDQSNDSGHNSGAVYIFTRSAGVWSQQAYVKASNTGGGATFFFNGDLFGSAVALSADGNTLAVGAPAEDSNATGINGNQSDDSAADAGAVYVFVRAVGVWSQQAYVKASNAGTGDYFGSAVALSGDGQTLAVGAKWEDSGAIGVDGNQADNSAPDAGAVYVFTRAPGTWSQQAYVKASNTAATVPNLSTGSGDQFGSSLALSGDGNTLAVGAPAEDSIASGINGNQADESATNAGAVYVLTRSAGVWSHQAYIKASSTDGGDRFGSAVAFSGDGNALAVGARGEASGASGIGGNQADNSAPSAGAVYIFTRTAGSWSQQAYVKASNTDPLDGFGSAVALNFDGNTLVVGATGEDGTSPGIGGNQASNGPGGSGAAYLY
jgi:FG-GAP repeat